MAGVCKTCKSDDATRNKINRLLCDGKTSMRSIQDKFDITIGALSAHRNKCIPEMLEAAMEKRNINGGEYVFARVETLCDELDRLLSRAKGETPDSEGNTISIEDDADDDRALRVLGEMRKILELLGKLMGTINEGTTVNVITSDEYIAHRTLVVSIISKYPEAKAELMAALKDG